MPIPVSFTSNRKVIELLVLLDNIDSNSHFSLGRKFERIADQVGENLP